jgi:hypothetical protein
MKMEKERIEQALNCSVKCIITPYEETNYRSIVSAIIFK